MKKKNLEKFPYFILSVWLLYCLGLIYIVFNIEKVNDVAKNDTIDLLRAATVFSSVISLLCLSYKIIKKELELEGILCHFIVLFTLLILAIPLVTDNFIFLFMGGILFCVLLKLSGIWTSSSE